MYHFGPVKLPTENQTLGSMRQHHVPELLIEHLTKLQSMKVRRKIPSPRRSDRICVRRPSATASAATPLDLSSVENWIQESLKVPFLINSPTDKRQPFSFRAKRRSSSKLLSLPISKYLLPNCKAQASKRNVSPTLPSASRLECLKTNILARRPSKSHVAGFRTSVFATLACESEIKRTMNHFCDILFQNDMLPPHLTSVFHYETPIVMRMCQKYCLPHAKWSDSHEVCTCHAKCTFSDPLQIQTRTVRSLTRETLLSAFLLMLLKDRSTNG